MKTLMLMNQMNNQLNLLNNAINYVISYAQYNIGQYIVGALKAGKALRAGTKFSG